MPAVNYSDAEIWTKDQLECLFWIELAKRKERQTNGAAYTELVALHHELTAFFGSWNLEHGAPYDNGTDEFLDLVQFGYAVEDVADTYRVEALRSALEEFQARAQKAEDSLLYLDGFRLADFSVVTDLNLLHSWWIWISTAEGRNSLGAKGKFSNFGEAKSVETTEIARVTGSEQPVISAGENPSKVIRTFPNPVRIPRRVQARRVGSFSTDEHQISVDGELLHDQLILSFDLSRPLPSMREVELVLRNAHGSAQLQRDWSMFEGGVVSERWLKGSTSEKVDWVRLLTAPPGEHKLVTQQNNVAHFIFGLSCWDWVASGANAAEACRNTVDLLTNVRGDPYYPERQALYGLTEVVKPKVDAYEISDLPWNE